MGSETPNLRGMGVGEAHSAGAEFIFAQLAGRRIEGDVDKALDEFTDLRRVTTPTEQTGAGPLPGTPLSGAPAANDPLGSIVREHLQRASSTGVAAPPPSETASESDAQPETSAAQQSVAAHAEVRHENIDAAASAEQLADEASAAAAEVQEVQKEFAELFDGDAVKIAEAPREPAPAGEALPEKSNIDLEEAALSQAEFDALLNKPDTPVDAAPTDETESAIKSAEGVLEEELLQLMAEGPPPKAESPRLPQLQTETAAESLPPAAAPAHVDETPAEMPQAPVEAPVQTPEQASAAQIAAATPAEATTAMPAAMPTAPAGMTSPPVVVIEAPEEIEEAEEKPERGSLARDIFVMIGQLIDMPFRAISVSDKNIIGIAAFLLLMGGVTLWVIATFFFQPHYERPAGHGTVQTMGTSNAHSKLVAPTHEANEESHAPAATTPAINTAPAKPHEPAAEKPSQPAPAEPAAPAEHAGH